MNYGIRRFAGGFGRPLFVSGRPPCMAALRPIAERNKTMLTIIHGADFHLDAPFAKIGAAFGGRDHTTVMNGVEKVEKSLSSDKELQRVVKRIESKLK